MSKTAQRLQLSECLSCYVTHFGVIFGVFMVLNVIRKTRERRKNSLRIINSNHGFLCFVLRLEENFELSTSYFAVPLSFVCVRNEPDLLVPSAFSAQSTRARKLCKQIKIFYYVCTFHGTNKSFIQSEWKQNYCKNLFADRASSVKR